MDRCSLVSGAIKQRKKGWKVIQEYFRLAEKRESSLSLPKDIKNCPNECFPRTRGRLTTAGSPGSGGIKSKWQDFCQKEPNCCRTIGAPEMTWWQYLTASFPSVLSNARFHFVTQRDTGIFLLWVQYNKGWADDLSLALLMNSWPCICNSRLVTLRLTMLNLWAWLCCFQLVDHSIPRAWNTAQDTTFHSERAALSTAAPLY